MSTAVAVVAFGVAFGYLEAVVVVYLRAALGLAPGAVMAHDPATFGTFEAVEIARELATLVMIAAVGTLAGRTRLERLAWAAVVFGAWDIVYYAGLRLAIGWPPTLDTWDVLFFVPTPWVGPVWATPARRGLDRRRAGPGCRRPRRRSPRHPELPARHEPGRRGGLDRLAGLLGRHGACHRRQRRAHLRDTRAQPSFGPLPSEMVPSAGRRSARRIDLNQPNRRRLST